MKLFQLSVNGKFLDVSHGNSVVEAENNYAQKNGFKDMTDMLMNSTDIKTVETVIIKWYENTNPEYGESGPFSGTNPEQIADGKSLEFYHMAKDRFSRGECDDMKAELKRIQNEYISGLKIYTKWE